MSNAALFAKNYDQYFNFSPASSLNLAGKYDLVQGEYESTPAAGCLLVTGADGQCWERRASLAWAIDVCKMFLVT